MAYKAEIPYGAYWSTPFARWQGSLGNLNSVEFAAFVAKKELARRSIDPKTFDHAVLGLTVPQNHSFFGLPWYSGLVGCGHVGGPTLMQACATGVRVLLSAVQEVECGTATAVLAATCDRISNGPHLYYPAPLGPGGTGEHEDWVMDNFSHDPLGPHSMLRTAENVAAKHGIGTAEQHEVVLLREAQYRAALADDRAFHRRFMTLPFEVPDPKWRKTAATLADDEGVRSSNAEALARLKPVLEGGTVTFGGQTYPADGNAAIIVTEPGRAREFSRDPRIKVRLLGFGQARAALAFMPEAPIPAARRALAQAGLEIGKMDAVKTHNPFAVNDILFYREMGVDPKHMNNFGCSLVWGHPQAPMGTRSIIELIEELTIRGGGYGLFTGCAAGDSAMSVVLKVGD